MERPVSGRRQDAGERKQDDPDATPDRHHIRSRGLRCGRPVRQMHGTHGTQDIIFANEQSYPLSDCQTRLNLPISPEIKKPGQYT